MSALLLVALLASSSAFSQRTRQRRSVFHCPVLRAPYRRAGLLFGYASLTEAEIRAGIRLAAEA